MARWLGVSVVETDDLITAVKTATMPDQLPLLHYWDTHPQAQRWAARRMVELTVAVNDSLQSVFEAVQRPRPNRNRTRVDPSNDSS